MEQPRVNQGEKKTRHEPKPNNPMGLNTKKKERERIGADKWLNSK